MSAPADIAARLGIGEGELCVRTAYEFLADGRPVQLSTSWEPYDLTAGTLVVLPEGGPHAGAGVVNRMAAIGITTSHAVEQLEPRQVNAEEASLLGIQKAALVTHIRRTYYSDEGRPVETADIACQPLIARSSTRFRSTGSAASRESTPWPIGARKYGAGEAFKFRAHASTSTRP
ncbi:hypothetical protein TPA0905_51080 [Streptomyces olivaceus]|nr:hypothetical protein TPA0905_51080 [Streptomyces olivaceus]